MSAAIASGSGTGASVGTAREKSEIRCLLVGVRGHGGEEVYSNLLRDSPPPGVRVSATFDFHQSCEWGRCNATREVLLNRLLHPWLRFDLGFRVLSVDSSVDLVHVHSHPTILRRRDHPPVVFSAGSSHYHYVRDYEKWSERKIRARYARARRLYKQFGVLDALLNHDSIAVAYTFSEYARKTYRDFGVPARKIYVLYPGFSIANVSRRESEKDRVVFLFMGRQSARKGGDTVLDAFQALRETMAGVRLVFVSDELPGREIAGVEAKRLVPAGEVGNLYSRADVFINPTRAEGFGFANVEAQGYGLPVISSRLGAIPEVVEDGKTGLLVDPDDREAVLGAMRRLASEQSLRREMSAAARERFVSRFSLEVFQAGLKQLYEEALRRP